MGSSVTKRGGSNAATLVLVIGRVVLSSHRSHDWQILITSSGSEIHEAKSCMLRIWMSFVLALPIRYGPLAQYSSTNLAPMSCLTLIHEQSENHLRPFFILITSVHQIILFHDHRPPKMETQAVVGCCSPSTSTTQNRNPNNTACRIKGPLTLEAWSCVFFTRFVARRVTSL
jgi:hypothetical protein